MSKAGTKPSGPSARTAVVKTTWFTPFLQRSTGRHMYPEVGGSPSGHSDLLDFLISASHSCAFQINASRLEAPAKYFDLLASVCSASSPSGLHNDKWVAH